MKKGLQQQKSSTKTVFITTSKLTSSSKFSITEHYTQYTVSNVVIFVHIAHIKL